MIFQVQGFELPNLVENEADDCRAVRLAKITFEGKGIFFMWMMGDRKSCNGYKLKENRL